MKTASGCVKWPLAGPSGTMVRYGTFRCPARLSPITLRVFPTSRQRAEVQQGVTYRDISVRSRIASELVPPRSEPEATKAAKQKAEDLGVDLSEISGSGVERRITFKDVVRTAQG